MYTATLPKPKPVRVLKTKKRKKVSSRTMLERRLDALVREIVLDRDEDCVCPAPKRGHGDARQCGHLISRAKKKVRWDLFNCSVQCNSCNFIHEHHPHFYTHWFLREFGQAQYEKLCADSEVTGKLSLFEMEHLTSNLDAIRRRQIDNPKEFKPRFTQEQIMTGTWKFENENMPLLRN